LRSGPVRAPPHRARGPRRGGVGPAAQPRRSGRRAGAAAGRAAAGRRRSDRRRSRRAMTMARPPGAGHRSA